MLPRSIRKLGAGWEKNVSPEWTNVIFVLSCFIGVASELVYILLCHTSVCAGNLGSQTEGSRFHSLPFFPSISSAPFSMCRLPLWSSET
jgi:hypothetical protein